MTLFLPILLPMRLCFSKGIKNFMKDDAVYIMSGIIDTRAEEVKASVSQYFDIIEEHLDNGWACFAARRAAVPNS